MRKMVMAGLIIICSVVIIASFFMVWAKAVTTATKVTTGVKEKVSETLGGSPFGAKLIANIDKANVALSEFGDVQFKTIVRGYEIPVMVNRKSSKTALSFIQVINPEAEGVGNKVLLIYLIPFLAIACIALAVLGLKNDIFVMIIILISGVISIGGLYKVMTANITNNIVQITLERGLWQTLYGYLLIFVFSILWVATNRIGVLGRGNAGKK